MENAPLKVFVIYAHEDKSVRDKLLRQLRPLADNGEITLWSDHEIMPGEVWDDAIRTRLTESDLILLLISDDFFASDYIQKVELRAALDRHKRGETQILPIIARHCGWEDLPALSRLQVLPPEGRPVISKEWNSPDEPYHQIYQGVRTIVREIRRAATPVVAPVAPPVAPRPIPAAAPIAPAPTVSYTMAPPTVQWRKYAQWLVLVVGLSGVGYAVWPKSGAPDTAQNQPKQSTPQQESPAVIIPNPQPEKKQEAPPKTNVSTDKNTKPPADNPGKTPVKPPASSGSKAATIGKVKLKEPFTVLEAPYDQKLGTTAVEGMWRVKKGRLFGFLNVQTNKVIGWYDAAENFHNGEGYVQKNGRYYYIDKDGKEVTPVPRKIERNSGGGG